MEVEMKKLALITYIALLALAGCGPTPTPMPTPVPPTPTSAPTPVPPTATPAPPTATLVPPTPTAVPIPERNYPAAIKAVFQARPQDWIRDMDFFKDLGINTIRINFAYLCEWGPEHRLAHAPPMTGEYQLVYPAPPGAPPSEEYIRQLILTARGEGFAVVLGPMVGRIGDPSPVEQFDDWERFKADSIEIVVRWAAIAEELQVEYFMPFCELNFVLFTQEDPERLGEPRYSFDEVMAMIAEWDSEALPQIRAVYSGRLMTQIYSTFPGSLLQYPVAGYDIVGIAYHPPADVQGMTTGFRAVLEDVQMLAQREGLSWLVIEMDVIPEGLGTDSDALETQAELWGMATEEYLRATTVPPVGFGTFLEFWSPEGRLSLEGTPSEDVFREFFAKLDE